MRKKKATTTPPQAKPAAQAPADTVAAIEPAAPTFGRVWGLGHFVMERP